MPDLFLSDFNRENYIDLRTQLDLFVSESVSELRREITCCLALVNKLPLRGSSLSGKFGLPPCLLPLRGRCWVFISGWQSPDYPINSWPLLVIGAHCSIEGDDRQQRNVCGCFLEVDFIAQYLLPREVVEVAATFGYPLPYWIAEKKYQFKARNHQRVVTLFFHLTNML
ncbi:hypothetical protein CDAR_4711 [Caerostris darwini]|uniref:Uncharacterized protein n=1 Tax=Caerostris darwini TaxID=1538125 RepID=A0AAV4P703_9ARAC|nr:hypothetical protein CDAR_4711 [Caerostris darwini]